MSKKTERRKLEYPGYVFENEEQAELIITYLLEHKFAYKWKDIKQMSFSKKSFLFRKKQKYVKI